MCTSVLTLSRNIKEALSPIRTPQIFTRLIWAKLHMRKFKYHANQKSRRMNSQESQCPISTPVQFSSHCFPTLNSFVLPAGRSNE